MNKYEIVTKFFNNQALEYLKLKNNYMENTNWQEEYKKKFGLCSETGFKCRRAEEIKFITDLLEQEKNKWLEALPKERKNPLRNDFVDGYDNGWNDCLQTILREMRDNDLKKHTQDYNGKVYTHEEIIKQQLTK
jgi:hypothetical protein